MTRRLLILLVGLLVTAGLASPAQATPGDLDPSFGTGGLVASSFGSQTAAGGMALQADGKIVVVGEAVGGDWAISRFNSDGSPDTSFSGDGQQTLDFGGHETAAGIVIQPDGKLVVIGWVFVSGVDVFAVARFAADGSLDTSFAGDGIQTTDFEDDATPVDVALQADGKIVVVGQLIAGGSDYATALARYNADGSLDTGFGSGGTQVTDLGNVGSGSEGASAVAIQPDGKLVVASLAGGEHFLTLRYTADGSLDPSFSEDGMQTTAFQFHSNAFDVALQDDGKIVVIGDAYSETGGEDFGVVRYNPDGSPDDGFSGDGVQLVSFGGEIDVPHALALQNDGRIVIAGVALAVPNTVDYGFGIARLNPNGSLDPDFGGDGKVTTVFEDGYAEAHGVAVQADGKIVAAGKLTPHEAGNDQLVMARYLGGGGTTPPDAPVNIGLPQIRGTPEVGALLVASVGVWLGDDLDLNDFQWLRDGLPIEGEIFQGYVVTTADQGHELAVRVTATNSSGSASATSAPVSVPAAVSPRRTTTTPRPPIITPPLLPSTASVEKIRVQGTRVVVRLRCSLGVGSCPKISARLSIRAQVKDGKITGVSAKRGPTRRLAIGRASIQLQAGQTKVLRVGLNRTGRKLLRRFGDIRATLRVATGSELLRRKVVGVG